MTFVSALRVNLWLGTAQVNLSTIHVRFLYILNQMLGNCFILERHKSKPATCVSSGLFHNLDFFNQPILAEKPTQLLFSQLVINPTNEYLVTCTALAAATLRLLLLALVATLTIVPIARSPISATTATTPAGTISPIGLTLLFDSVIRRLRNQKTICRLISIP